MMKNLFFLACIVFASCKNNPKNYASISGKISNKSSDSIVIRTKDYSKTIKVNTDGTFSDTLNVKPDIYNFFDGKQSTFIFLRNGFELEIALDANDFYKSIKFSGTGSEHSTFIAKNNILNEQLLNLDKLSNLNLTQLNSEFKTIRKKLSRFYDDNTNVDTLITNRLRKDLDPMLNYYKGNLEQYITLKTTLGEGAKSPDFKNYENFKGGFTSLSDFKGKYVYLDIWASWCGPCIAEIPALKKLEHTYKVNNIEFVSISIDDQKQAWKQFVLDKQLSGIQLLAPNGWKSEFIQNYKITGIPRFILIDPQGKIVTSDAPRPSQEELSNLFKKLKI